MKFIIYIFIPIVHFLLFPQAKAADNSDSGFVAFASNMKKMTIKVWPDSIIIYPGGGVTYESRWLLKFDKSTECLEVTPPDSFGVSKINIHTKTVLSLPAGSSFTACTAFCLLKKRVINLIDQARLQIAQNSIFSPSQRDPAMNFNYDAKKCEYQFYDRSPTPVSPLQLEEVLVDGISAIKVNFDDTEDLFISPIPTSRTAGQIVENIQTVAPNISSYSSASSVASGSTATQKTTTVLDTVSVRKKRERRVVTASPAATAQATKQDQKKMPVTRKVAEMIEPDYTQIFATPRKWQAVCDACKQKTQEISPDLYNTLEKIAGLTLKKAKPKTKHILQLGFYQLGFMIPVMYACGIDEGVILQLDHSDRILKQLKRYNFSRLHLYFESLFSPIPTDMVQSLDLIELAVLIKNDRFFFPALPNREQPKLLLELYPFLTNHSKKRVLQELLVSRFKKECSTPSQEIPVVIRTLGAIATQPKIAKVYNSSNRSAMGLVAAFFNKGFKVVQKNDRYHYEYVWNDDRPERVRIHTIGAMNNLLYGIYLNDPILFDEKVTELSSAFILVTSSPTTNEEMHALLIARNAATRQYCSFQVRQGSYYPEYMNHENLLSYIRQEKIKIRYAISLDQFAAISNSKMDYKLLRLTLKERMQRKWNYIPTHHNCLTFALLALNACQLSGMELLERAGLENWQSPARFMSALYKHPANRCAFHPDAASSLPLDLYDHFEFVEVQ